MQRWLSTFFSLGPPQTFPDLVALRDRVVGLSVKLVLIFSFPQLAIMAGKSIGAGDSNWYLTLQIGCFTCLLASFILKGKLGTARLSQALVVIVFAIGLGGIFAWGPAPSRILILSFACLFAAVFNGTASALAFNTIAALGMAVASNVYHLTICEGNGDSISDHSQAQWLVTILVFFCATTTVSLLVGWVMKTLQGTILALKEKSDDLLHTNDILQEQALQLEEQAVQLEEQAVVLEEQAEVLKSQRDQAKTAVLAKDRFLAVVSHELRTPLNPILGFLDILESDLNASAESQEQIALMKRSGLRLLRMIDRVVDYSEMARGEIVLRRSEVSWEDLSALVCTEFEEDAKEKGISFSVSVPANDQSVLVIDKRRVYQLIEELGENAIKFTESGKVEFAFELLEVKDAAAVLQLTVSDTGCGIQECELDSLFAPFANNANSRAKAFSGMGLGLAACDVLVKAMDGTIEVKSAVEVGTRFSVQIPIELSNGYRTAKTNSRGPLTLDRPLEILIAEDDRVNQKVVSKLLSRMGASCSCVENGKLAIESLSKKRFDLVLMDVNMPIMDGIDATRVIRQMQGISDTPIVALTAHSYSASEFACFEAGMNAFLTKPIKAAQLHEKITSVMEARENAGATYHWVEN